MISREAKDFIRKLIQVNPKRRMTVDQALDHPWFVKQQQQHNIIDSKSCSISVEEDTKKKLLRKKDSVLSFRGIGQRKVRLSMFRL